MRCSVRAGTVWTSARSSSSSSRRLIPSTRAASDFGLGSRLRPAASTANTRAHVAALIIRSSCSGSLPKSGKDDRGEVGTLEDRRGDRERERGAERARAGDRAPPRPRMPAPVGQARSLASPGRASSPRERDLDGRRGDLERTTLGTVPGLAFIRWSGLRSRLRRTGLVHELSDPRRGGTRGGEAASPDPGRGLALVPDAVPGRDSWYGAVIS